MVVFDEAVYVVGRRIRRVHENEIAVLGFGDHGLKIATSKIGHSQKFAGFFEIVVRKHYLRLCADGHVELPLQIFTIEAVEAGSIQVEELSCTKVRSSVASPSFLIIELLRVLRLEDGEARLHQLPFIPNRAVGRDESLIRVRYDRV